MVFAWQANPGYKLGGAKMIISFPRQSNSKPKPILKNTYLQEHTLVVHVYR